MQRLLADADVEPVVTGWHTVYARKHPDTDRPGQALVHVRGLLPEGETRNVSAMTTAWLTERLYAYPVPGDAAASARGVERVLRLRHAGDGPLAVNPMLTVDKPTRRKPLISSTNWIR